MDGFKGKQKATAAQVLDIPAAGGRIVIETAPDTAPAHVLDEYLTEGQFAEQIGRTVRTVRRWRSFKEGPSWVQLGRQVYYKRTTVREWFGSLEREI
jgi:hypothetical protein